MGPIVTRVENGSSAVTQVWQAGRFVIDLTQPRVMGIVNVTPDSFSDGGHHADATSALRHAEQLLREGAHILDIGGESTRPGSPPVDEAEELRRVLPVVQAAVPFGVPLSVDTYKPAVMRAALDAGADIVNDVWALRQAGAEDAVAGHPSCGVCLMHMHRDPSSMQTAPMEGDVVPAVHAFLADRGAALQAQGVAADRIVLDPGIGFGKTVEQNFHLLAHQRAAVPLPYAILAGWSRKSSLGSVTGRSVQDRMAASIAAALLAVERGAAVVRVHDVAATADALAILRAVHHHNAPSPDSKRKETFP